MADSNSTRCRPLAERFWKKVRKTDTCWLWIGAHGPSGHGVISSGGGKHQKHLRATAVSWEIANGPVPDGFDICHHCDNPPCVNPAHLFLGTALDNMRDCIKKGRFKFLKPRPGETNNNVKLTWPIVRDIRAAYAAGENLSDLSRHYLVARSTLREIVTGRCWREPGVAISPRLAPTRKLTAAQIADIARRRRGGESTAALSTEFNIHQSTVCRIALHRSRAL